MPVKAAADLISELRIDEATWAAGSEARQVEWRLLCADVIEEGRLGWEPPSEGARDVPIDAKRRGRVRLGPGDVRLELLDHSAGWDDDAAVSDAVRLQTLVPLVDEYLNVCRDMTKMGLAQGTHSPRLEALDIAKRITHDEAAELIQTSLTTLRPDHGTARRLFSLFVTLLRDTTKLSARPHTVHL